MFGKHEKRCSKQFYVGFFFGMEYLRVFGFVLLMVELQEPDGWNDTDEKQKDWRRKPARQTVFYQHNIIIKILGIKSIFHSVLAGEYYNCVKLE